MLSCSLLLAALFHECFLVFSFISRHSYFPFLVFYKTARPVCNWVNKFVCPHGAIVTVGATPALLRPHVDQNGVENKNQCGRNAQDVLTSDKESYSRETEKDYFEE